MGNAGSSTTPAMNSAEQLGKPVSPPKIKGEDNFLEQKQRTNNDTVSLFADVDGAISCYNVAIDPERHPLITGYVNDERKGHLYYTIDIPGNRGRLSAYNIKRRMSQFRQLHKYLSTAAVAAAGRTDGLTEGTENDFHLPAFPEDNVFHKLARYGFGYRGDALMLDRITRLQVILSIAAGSTVASHSQAYLDFIGKPPDDVATSEYVSLGGYGIPRQLTFACELTERRRMASRYLSGSRRIAVTRRLKSRRKPQLMSQVRRKDMGSRHHHLYDHESNSTRKRRGVVGSIVEEIGVSDDSERSETERDVYMDDSSPPVRVSESFFAAHSEVARLNSAW